MLERSGADSLVVDLTATPRPGAWCVRDQHGRPIGVDFAFVASRAFPEVHVENASGEVCAWGRLGRGRDVAATVANGLAWSCRLLAGALREYLSGRADGAGRATEPAGMPLAAGWRLVATDCLGRARERIRSWLIDETWAIGCIDAPIATVTRSPKPDEIAWIEAPTGSYYADPFGMPGEAGILCERLDHASGIGRLVRLVPNAAGALLEIPIELSHRGHASFPFLAVHDNRLLCMPENAASRRLALWERSPAGSWQPMAEIEGIAAIDPALFFWQGHWWIAFTDGDLGEHDNLCLLHAECPEGPWRAHPRNPVKVDVRSSRSAGTPYLADGKLWRPAQDCAATYGAAVVISQVTELTTERFAEVEVRRLTPQANWPYPHGFHTLTAWGDRTLIDAKRHGIVPAAIARRVLSRLRRRRIDPHSVHSLTHRTVP
jgi:hypothetical protein